MAVEEKDLLGETRVSGLFTTFLPLLNWHQVVHVEFASGS